MEQFFEFIKAMVADGRLILIGVTDSGNNIYKPNPESQLDCSW